MLDWASFVTMTKSVTMFILAFLHCVPSILAAIHGTLKCTNETVLYAIKYDSAKNQLQSLCNKPLAHCKGPNGVVPNSEWTKTCARKPECSSDEFINGFEGDTALWCCKIPSGCSIPADAPQRTAKLNVGGMVNFNPAVKRDSAPGSAPQYQFAFVQKIFSNSDDETKRQRRQAGSVTLVIITVPDYVPITTMTTTTRKGIPCGTMFGIMPDCMGYVPTATMTPTTRKGIPCSTMFGKMPGCIGYVPTTTTRKDIPCGTMFQYVQDSCVTVCNLMTQTSCRLSYYDQYSCLWLSQRPMLLDNAAVDFYLSLMQKLQLSSIWLGVTYLRNTWQWDDGQEVAAQLQNDWQLNAAASEGKACVVMNFDSQTRMAMVIPVRCDFAYATTICLKPPNYTFMN